MNTKTVNEPFAGPVRYSARPKARLNWDTWRSGMPSFQFPELEDQQKLDEQAERMCKGKSAQKIRAMANAYTGDFYMRSRLYKLADIVDQKERAKRLSNRQGHRPLGFSSAHWHTLTNRS